MIGITSLARFAGDLRLAGGVSRLREGGVARHRARVQPVQVQLVPGQRRAPVVAGGARRCSSRSPSTPAKAGSASWRPILTFQSVVDFTVSTRAIVNALYVNLPANGSELVLFDLNRQRQVRPAAAPQHRHRAGAAAARRRRGRSGPRSSPTPAPATREVVERVTEAGATTEQTRQLGSDVPAGRVLAVAPGAAVSDERFALRAGAGVAATSTASTSARWRRAASAAR